MSLLKNQNVEYLHFTGIDNILTKWADPLMIGVLDNRPEELVLCKFAKKLHPFEKTGVFAMVEGQPYVVEYSIIGETLAQKRDLDTQELMYGMSNILNFMFRIRFFEDYAMNPKNIQLLTSKYNVAVKDVQHFVFGKGNEIVTEKVPKFELFVHECFRLCPVDKFSLLACDRYEEFAPIKNSTKEPVDNPETALSMYAKYHQKLLQSAGYQIGRC